MGLNSMLANRRSLESATVGAFRMEIMAKLMAGATQVTWQALARTPGRT